MTHEHSRAHRAYLWFLIIVVLFLFVYVGGSSVEAAMEGLQTKSKPEIIPHSSERRKHSYLRSESSGEQQESRSRINERPIIGVMTEPFAPLEEIRGFHSSSSSSSSSSKSSSSSRMRRRMSSNSKSRTLRESSPWSNMFAFDQEGNELRRILSESAGKSATEYIAASYVKWIESAGGRVVPIRFSWSPEELRNIFSKINGLLLPGGGADIHPKTSRYYEAVQVLWDLAMDANLNQSDYFPVWGTCLGFEQLGVLAAGSDYSILDDSGGFASEDQTLPLYLSPLARVSRMFRGLSLTDTLEMGRHNSTYNSHVMGISPKAFYQHAKLRSFFRPLATGQDKNGKVFLAAMEARSPKLPIYGVQFHPEKVSFEWDQHTSIPHSYPARALSAHLANVFVDEARKNSHKFPGGAKEESKHLIENSVRKYMGTDSYFMEIFFMYG